MHCCEVLHWTPNQVAELTPAQLFPFLIARRKPHASTAAAVKELKAVEAERNEWVQKQLSVLAVSAGV